MDTAFSLDPIRLATPVTARGLRIRMSLVWDLANSVYYIAEFQVHAATYSGNNLGDLGKLSDGTQVTVSGKMVTAAPGTGGVPSNVFYIEESDRDAGMRVSSTVPVVVGQSATVSGAMSTTPGGERYIDATSVTTASGTTLGPLATNTRNLATGLMDGLLAKVFGTVRTVGADYYTIADGYTTAA